MKRPSFQSTNVFHAVCHSSLPTDRFSSFQATVSQSNGASVSLVNFAHYSYVLSIRTVIIIHLVL